MKLTTIWIGPALVCLPLLTLACSGSKSRTSQAGASSDFELLRVTPPDNAALFLNDAIQFDFTTPVDLTTADLNSISFNTFDLSGNPLGEQPRGSFRLAASPGDAEPGRRLEFVPVLPTDDLFSDGGFKPARRYIVQLVGGDRRNGVVLRDTRGKELGTPVSFSFTTVDGDTANELFRDTRQGGPRRAGFDVVPSTVSASGVRTVVPNFNVVEPLAVRLTFDQAVNPQSANVPARIDLDPRTRDASRRGRVFLEYDDPSTNGANTWIPAEVEMEVNTIDQAIVVLRPVGALPNNAPIRVRVLNTFEDIAGVSNIADAAYSDLFGSFVVEPRHEPQFDALVERFAGVGAVDLGAPFLEPVASVEDGAVSASLDFEGQDSAVDFEPSQQETILNTDFTRITLRSGRSLNISGGVFEFRNVRIPRDYRVIGQGSKPMVWLVTGNMTIEGDLRVDGGDGEAVSSTSADIPALGGAGRCNGGRGGRGSVVTTARTNRGENGFGAGDIAGQGGEGGQHSCQSLAQTNNCRIGSGGGGGSFVTKGDPDFYTRFQVFRAMTNGEFDMIFGDGRVGCQNKNAANNPGVAPGVAGPLAFIDAEPNNNFFGSVVRFTPTGVPSTRLAGELAGIRGGSGGGGGGDGSTDCNPTATTWRTDAKGGGGGAGGGILIIKCLGKVRIASTGHISANGGHGGGGFPNGTSAASATGPAGAGGGGGSGGMVVIAASRLEIVRHGDTYGDATLARRTAGAYDFAITADGGVGKRNPQAGLMPIRGKYPSSFITGETPETAANWHSDIGDRPAGGLGGSGLVQLMTPSLDDRDGTGAFFDDNIHFYASDNDVETNSPLPAAAKKALLGWRGYVSGANRVDDKNATITLPANGFGIGDIKPAPILLPAPFGPLTRVVSRPIDLGRVDRTESNVAQGVRTIVPRGNAAGDPFTNLMAGPTYAFDGSEWQASSTAPGYLATNAGVQAAPVVAGSASAVARIVSDATFQTRVAYKVELAANNPVLAQIPGRYTGYLAQLLTGSDVVGEFRVVGHDGTSIYLDPQGAGVLPTGVTRVQLAGKFVVVETGGVKGLGATANGAPLANVRVGFAFYRNATDPTTRFPLTGFRYDLNTNNTELVRTLRDGRYRYVQYDIVFNTLFSPTATTNNNVDRDRTIRPSAPRPKVRELVLPFQF